MGDISRSAEASDFIKEFGKDLEDQLTLSDEPLVVESQAVSYAPGDDGVRFYVTLKGTWTGKTFELMLDRVLFTPETFDVDETAAGLAGLLGVPEPAIQERMKRAGLA